MRQGLGRAVVAALPVAVVIVAGCGGEGAARFPATGSRSSPGGGGELAYAIPSAPRKLDPLAARTISAQTVTRQIFEPLVARLDAPYGRRRDVPGIALAVHSSGDRRVWSVRLRPGVRFQDGSPVDASAVLANAQRWRTSSTGRRLLPGLIAADGPRPDLVRLVFSAPVPDLPSRLRDPRLGLVSPSALRPRSGISATVVRSERSGSGPFALVTRSGSRLVLRRTRAWWGSRRGLGPALDAISFRPVASVGRRLVLLRHGEVRVAGGVGGRPAKRIGAAPLLTVVGTAGPYPIAFERSVRGISSWRPESLSGAWLGLIGRG